MNLLRKLLRFSGIFFIEVIQSIRRCYFFCCSIAFCRQVKGQPILAYGRGKITLGNNVEIGFRSSPGYLNSYCYLEARQTEASIVISDNVKINNNFFAISNTASIFIGANTLIGLNVGIVDSDFHRIDHSKRGNNDAISAAVHVGQDVFIANDVKIYKGVKIGDGAVIGAGSVVMENVEPRSIVAGNPARLVKMIADV